MEKVGPEGVLQKLRDKNIDLDLPSVADEAV
jgi:hypothetical protein